MTPSFRLRQVVDSDAIREILALRVLAWRSFISVDPALLEWTDKFDDCAFHWAIMDGSVIVAAARLSIHDHLADVPDHEVYEPVLTSPLLPPIASMNRLVVHPSYRGLGLSDQLDEARISAARAAKCSCVIGYTSAGDKRVAQLVRKGFQARGTGRRYEHGLLKGLDGVVIYSSLEVAEIPLVDTQKVS